MERFVIIREKVEMRKRISVDCRINNRPLDSCVSARPGWAGASRTCRRQPPANWAVFNLDYVGHIRRADRSKRRLTKNGAPRIRSRALQERSFLRRAKRVSNRIVPMLRGPKG